MVWIREQAVSPYTMSWLVGVASRRPARLATLAMLGVGRVVGRRSPWSFRNPGCLIVSRYRDAAVVTKVRRALFSAAGLRVGGRMSLSPGSVEHSVKCRKDRLVSSSSCSGSPNSNNHPLRVDRGRWWESQNSHQHRW
jgi:hypothetical protein